MNEWSKQFNKCKTINYLKKQHIHDTEWMNE